MVRQRKMARSRRRGYCETDNVKGACSEDRPQSPQDKNSDVLSKDNHDDDTDLDKESSSSSEEEEDSLRCKRRRQSSPIPAQPTQSWKTEKDPDEVPPELPFQPARTPGVQGSAVDTHTPLDLFKLFLTEDAVRTLCDNTNKLAAIKVSKGIKYKWTNVGIDEFYKYVGLIFYMSVIRMTCTKDYWRQNNIFFIPFPATVMCRDRWAAITQNISISDPHKEQENDRHEGTQTHDNLFQARPLLDTIRTAFKSFYHPHKDLVMSHRTTGTNNFRLFVLADAVNGYTVDLYVHVVKKQTRHVGRKVSYGTVTSLVNPSFLGSGYHVYTDSFFTSPKLFRALHEQNFGACGLHSYGVKGCPHTITNALTKSSGRGTIRWIRDGPLLFVKWLDIEEISICSTFHTAYTGDTVQRRAKKKNGASATEVYPCPSPLVAYNKLMQGVVVFDQLSQYFATQHRTVDWSRKLFLHFLDMAARNACIIYNEVASQQQRVPLTHKTFIKKLIVQLCGTSPERVGSNHVPVPVAELSPKGGQRASQRQVTCVLCRKSKRKQQNTSWKCKGCGVALCMQVDRNCFEEWHRSH